jgi:DNA topoisomerase-1
MRTDSTNLSQLALNNAADYIQHQYGKDYYQLRTFKTKSAGAQEAHEAIRPTDFSRQNLGDDAQQQKLYDLIWRRTLASQMAPAQLEKSEITIQPSTTKPAFIAKGEVLQFDGFLKVYGGGKDDTILPAVEQGQKLPLNSMTATQTFSKSAARYSEAALVKKLEELGIGRPSTYAPTISTIQSRGYIEKKDLEGVEREVETSTLEKGTITSATRTEITGADRNKLVPTGIADMTTDFLTKHFGTVLDYDFTAKVEAEFDDIAEGKEKWQQMLKDFYKDFHPLIEGAADVSRQEASQARELGPDPKSGKPIIARYGRYGAMLQMGETESEEKPRFAPLPANTTLETVTLEQALEMFKLPRTVGLTEDGKEIKANIGRFGPYIQVDKLFVSVKGADPLTITLEEALVAYKEKLEKEANKYIQRFDSGIDVLNGQYGPYITDGKKNAKIPKDKEPAELTEKECKELLAAAPAKGKGRKFPKRKTAAKKK